MHLFTVSLVPHRVLGSDDPKVGHMCPLPRSGGRGRDRQVPRALLPMRSMLVEGTPGLWEQSEGIGEVVNPKLSLGTNVGGGQGKKAGKGDLGKGNCFGKAKEAEKNMAHTAFFLSSLTLGTKYR